MKLICACRLGTIMLIFAASSSCVRAKEDFRPQCERTAAVAVYEKSLWRKYILQNASGFVKDGERIRIFGTKDFGMLSQEAETGSYNQSFNTIYQNNFIIRRRGSNKIVAVVKNLSLRTRGFAANRSWTCIYDWPGLYEPFVTPA